MFSIFKLELKDTNGNKIQSRFAAKDESKTIKEVLEDQYKKLNVVASSILLPINIYVQQKGNPDSRAKVLDIDDLIEFDNEYFFVHPDYDNSSKNATTDSDNVIINNDSLISSDVSENALPDSPPEENTTASTSQNCASPECTKELLPCQITFNHQNKFYFLTDLYSANKEFIEKKLEELTSDKPYEFYGINILDHFNLPRHKAVLVLLKNEHLMAYDMKINKVVRDICQAALVDLVATVRERTTLPSNGLKPLLDYMFDITKNEFFNLLNTPDNSILVAARKRKERQQKKDGRIPNKRKKLNFGDDELDELNEAAKAISQAKTPKEEEELVKNSCAVRSQWIKSMDDKSKIRIPETVIQKFPALLRNAALLHYDFEYAMQHFFKLPLFNVIDGLKCYAAAIVLLSKDMKIVSMDTVIDENDSYEIIKLLIKLIPKYIKKSDRCQIERLIAESEDSPSVETLTQKRRDIEQPAPMIFIINLLQDQQYYISTDDVSLKVNGGFKNALQCLFELHFVFNLEYAKELKDLMMLIEQFCGINTQRMPKPRANLLLDLKAKQK